MVFITEELIRKKSEHNELLINTLEELSLHQENIERIEHVQNWCKRLRILLLQSNLIPRIENLYKLKQLEYLNLAINNIERVENLEALESLVKLDLTLNFIGELTTIESLKENYNLKELHLTGNPCTDYPEYRCYVIATLPQLNNLDGQEITRTEQLTALKCLTENRKKVVSRYDEYQFQRDLQKTRVQKELLDAEQELNQIVDEEERIKSRKSENCPETRCQIAKYSAKKRSDSKSTESESDEWKKTPTLFAPCGRPYSLNKAKLDFTLLDEPDRYELDLHIYRFLDTSLIDIEIHPTYVRVIVKGKIFQLALNDEIFIEKSTSQRSCITGNLLIKMPKLNAKEMVLVPLAKVSTSHKNNGGEKNSLVVDYKSIVLKDDEEACDKYAIINYNDMPELL